GAVTSALPGLCLEWPDGARAANLGTCNAQPSQNWSRPPDGTLVHAGLCLENGRDGALSLVECDGTPEQRWIPDAAGRIVNGSRNACLDAGGGAGRGPGAVPRARACDGSQGQVWYPPV
ncbi:MAG: RICIN domain-containing protein, partial [Streptomycetaceae bacterium]|nr:RICIN domain-containing protein [Streptomycetaceae bacterium]